MTEPITPRLIMDALLTLTMLGAIAFGLRGILRTRTGRWMLVVLGLIVLGCWAFFGFPLPRA